MALKVLIVSSEVAPYAKSGGLGDVIGSLPKALKAKGVDVLVYEPTVKDSYLDYAVEKDYEKFCAECGVIIANRVDGNLDAVKSKVYTRDIFGRN